MEHWTPERLAALPDDTRVWCGHDYALANARFAMAVEPGNGALAARAAEAQAAAAGARNLPAVAPYAPILLAISRITSLSRMIPTRRPPRITGRLMRW